MEHMVSRNHLNQGDVMVLDSDTQCNFMLLDDSNYAAYQAGRAFNYRGGFFTHFPARIVAPHSGNWNAVFDLDGGSAYVRHAFSVIRRGSLAGRIR